MATVLPLVSMQGQVIPQICAPVAGPPICVSPAVSVIPTACLRALHFEKSFLPLLAVLFTLSIAFALARLAFALALVLLACALARAGLAFGFIVHARQSTRLVVLQVFGFLCTISRNVTVNSTPRTVSLNILILTAHHRQIHRLRLCVSFC